jgi:HPt (histidine-containing phosphotransfer) domain-containing protein/two-component sensor histidine kinase
MQEFQRLKWYEGFGFKVFVGMVMLAGWLLTGIVIVMRSKGTDLVLTESRRLIEQTGNNAVAELQSRLTEIAALARSMSELAQALPKQPDVFHKTFPPIIGFQNDLAVAGGGYWPEPFKFDAKKERNSFFWGRNKEGKLEYFDDYNKPGPGYHNEEWYVVARYAKPGRCFWSRSYTDPYSFQPMSTCTVGTFEKGQFTGEVTVDVKLEGLAAMAQDWTKKTGGYVFILDRNNKFLTFPDMNLIKKISKDDKGNKTEEFIFANDLTAKEPLFAPISKALERMNKEILEYAQKNAQFKANLADKIDTASYQIDKGEADFINAVIIDPLETASTQTKLYRSFVFDNDFVTKEKSMAFLFHVPSSYWKVVVVKPFSEAGAVAASITRLLILYLSLTVLAVAIAGYLLLKRSILKPLARTTREIQTIGELVSNHDFESLAAVRTAPVGRNEIGLLANGFAGLTQRVVEAHVRIALSSDALKRVNENLENTVRERTEKLQTILNNVQSGFFLIDQDFIVQEGFTLSCTALFEGRIAPHLRLPEILDLKGKDISTFELLTGQIFEDVLPEDVSISQLPKRFPLKERTLSLDVRAVRDEQDKIKLLLFTVTDVTALENAERDIQNIQAVLKILAQRDSFEMFLDHSKQSLIEAAEACEKNDASKVRICFHTLKGNSASFGLLETAALIHKIEDESQLTQEHVNKIKESLMAFLAQNYDVLGISFEGNSKRELLISESIVQQLKQKTTEFHTLAEARAGVERWVENVMLKEIGTLVRPLPEFVRRLGERLGKDVVLEMQGQDIRVDANIMTPILQSMTHLLRNAVDHGIETGGQRHLKPPQAILRLEFSEDESFWNISLSDDGIGIRTEVLARKALQKGLLTAAQLAVMSRSEKLQLIFEDGLSTAETMSDISGRGVGMPAVANSVYQAGGTLTVESIEGEGTTFTLRIPRIQKSLEEVKFNSRKSS